MNKLLSMLTVLAVCGCVMADGELPEEVLSQLNDQNRDRLYCNETLDQDGMKRLMDELKNNTHIKQLWLSGKKTIMDETSVGYLAELMKENNIIEEILLSRHSMTWSGLVKLGGILERNDSSLKRLVLDGSIMSANDADVSNINAFLESLKKNRTLKTLALYNNCIGDFSRGEELIMKALKEWLTGNASLEKLVLWGENLSTEGVKILGEALNFNTTLKELDLSENKNNQVIKTLASNVDNNSSLEKLRLRYISIQKKDFKYLGLLLKNFKNLKELDLEDNDIKDQYAKILGEALSSNETLKVLSLSYYPYTPIIEALASSVANNSSLEKLRLYWEPKKELEHLGDFLEKFKNLKELVLDGHEIDEDGVKNLCEIFRNVTSDLRCIDLGTIILSPNCRKMLKEFNESEKPRLKIRRDPIYDGESFDEDMAE